MITQLRIIIVVAITCASLRLIAGAVTGTIRTMTRAGVSAAPAVVYAEPIDVPALRAPRRFTLAQKNKSFQPHLLAVPVGSTVDFPNGDGIYHNVFSLSGPQPFDLGLYRSGETRQRTFTSPGTYRVFCNIHPQMTALIVVVPIGHTAVTASDGRFTLDLPPGRFRLTALSERSSPVSVEMMSAQGASSAPELTLDESSWVNVPHKNKFGQDYPAAAYQR